LCGFEDELFSGLIDGGCALQGGGGGDAEVGQDAFDWTRRFRAAAARSGRLGRMLSLPRRSAVSAGLNDGAGGGEDLAWRATAVAMVAMSVVAWTLVASASR
jgi:hypothetical protein